LTGTVAALPFRLAAKAAAPTPHACVAPAGIGLSPKASAPALDACVVRAGIVLSPKAAAPALLRFNVAVGFADFPAVLARPAPRLNSQRSPSAHSARTVAAKHEDEARRLRLRAGRPALRSSAPRRRCASRTQPPSWGTPVARVRRSVRLEGSGAFAKLLAASSRGTSCAPAASLRRSRSRRAEPCRAVPTPGSTAELVRRGGGCSPLWTELRPLLRTMAAAFVHN